MKASKIIAFVLTVGAVFTAPTVVFTQSAERIESEFILGEETLPVPSAQIGDHYYEAGIIEYFGEEIEPIELKNDEFEKALPFMCYGGGGTNRWDCSWEIPLLCPEYDSDDVLYVTFSYKSADRFDGYTGNNSTVQTRYNGETDNNYPIYRNMETADFAVPTLVADGKWHTVHLYAEGTKVIEPILKLNFLDMKKPQYVLFAGFRCGVIKNNSDIGYNEDRAYTELGWHLQKIDTEKLIINSKEINLKEETVEITVPAEDDILSVELDSNAKSYISDIKKLSQGVYEVTVAAPGYVKWADDAAEINFRRKIDASGEFSQGSTAEVYKVLNGSMKRTYTINLLLKSANAKIFVDGEEKTDISDCVGGEEITADVTYMNIKGENKTFITVITICKDGTAVAVLPAREVMAEDVAEVTKQYSYTLPEGDYEGAEVKLYVIDTANMFDVFN